MVKFVAEEKDYIVQPWSDFEMNQVGLKNLLNHEFSLLKTMRLHGGIEALKQVITADTAEFYKELGVSLLLKKGALSIVDVDAIQNSKLIYLAKANGYGSVMRLLSEHDPLINWLVNFPEKNLIGWLGRNSTQKPPEKPTKTQKNVNTKNAKSKLREFRKMFEDNQNIYNQKNPKPENEKDVKMLEPENEKNVKRLEPEQIEWLNNLAKKSNELQKFTEKQAKQIAALRVQNNSLERFVQNLTEEARLNVWEKQLWKLVKADHAWADIKQNFDVRAGLVESFIGLRPYANIDCVNRDGLSPLYWCLLEDKLEMFDFLLELKKLINWGANIEAKLEDGSYIAKHAIETQKLTATKIEKIVENAPKSDKEVHFLSALYDAVKNVETKRWIAQQVLFQAAKQNNLFLAEEALSADANIEAVNSSNESALEIACFYQSEKVVELLLKVGARVPEHLASPEVSEDAVTVLLSEYIQHQRIEKESFCKILSKTLESGYKERCEAAESAYEATLVPRGREALHFYAETATELSKLSLSSKLSSELFAYQSALKDGTREAWKKQEGPGTLESLLRGAEGEANIVKYKKS